MKGKYYDDDSIQTALKLIFSSSRLIKYRPLRKGLKKTKIYYF